jgi:membrane-bound lytic murein transglycosylase B
MAAKLNKKESLAKGRVAVCLLAALVIILAPTSALAMKPVFQPLAKYLQSRGMTQAQVKSLLSSPRLKFQGKLLTGLLAKSEKSRNYAQFLAPTTVALAKKFARRHESLLAESQRAFGVPGSVVVAILTIESGLGSYTGRWNTMSVLASQAVLDSKEGRKQLYRHWPARQRAYFHSAEFDKRLNWRAGWARGEVFALLHLAAKHRVSPYAFKGSVAGAMGMSQFVPSSILKHGTDGDADGKVDLDNPHDAVHSVSVYLLVHGWRPGLSREEQMEVIRTYNKSTPYANTVLDLAGKL